MSLYVCDFTTVEEEGTATCNVARKLDEGVYDYQVAIESNLSQWTGSARNSFNKANDSLVKTAQEEIITCNRVGEFVLLVREAIYELEEDLSGMNI